MEETWEEFWKSGKINDYLCYCTGSQIQKNEERREYASSGGVYSDGAFCKQKDEEYVAAGCVDWYGTDHHAHQ